jgi:hypothetical protein
MAITVGDLQYQAEKPKMVKLFNPDFDDFKVKWHGEEIVFHAQEIAEFEAPIANHVKKHLADKLMGQTGISYPSAEEWQKIYKKIEVDYYGQ